MNHLRILFEFCAWFLGSYKQFSVRTCLNVVDILHTCHDHRVIVRVTSSHDVVVM